MKIANIALLLSLMTATSAEEWDFFGTSGSHEHVELLRTLNATELIHDEESEGSVPPSNTTRRGHSIADTEVVLAFVVMRHGDRTPSRSELSFLSSERANWTKVLFPYGTLALTNKGKLRSYYVGKYLRERYDGLISRMFLNTEVQVRSTDYLRTKMAALATLAALYSPLTKEQRWNRNLDWLPVPYSTKPSDQDDLVFWKNCPKYGRLSVYDDPVIKESIELHGTIFEELSRRTNTNVSTPYHAWFLANLFEGLKTVKYPIPKWAQVLMPQIKELTKIEYSARNTKEDALRMSAGVLINDILNATNSFVHGMTAQPKLRIYSAHENNVAALMGVVGVFEPHQPSCGSSFTLELRVHRRTGEYGVAAVYAPEAGGPGKVLPMNGCRGAIVCDYATFLAVTEKFIVTKTNHKKECYS